MPSGRWLVETGQPLTGEQLSTAREVAAGAGLTIESRDQQQGLAALRTGATAVGMLLALGVLAMTVGLIRSEAAADVRTLTATGATSGTRRTLTAATAGALAFLGVVLGTAGAYVALMAGHVRDLGELSPVPVFTSRRSSSAHRWPRRCRMAARRPRAARPRPSTDRVTASQAFRRVRGGHDHRAEPPRSPATRDVDLLARASRGSTVPSAPEAPTIDNGYRRLTVRIDHALRATLGCSLAERVSETLVPPRSVGARYAWLQAAELVGDVPNPAPRGAGETRSAEPVTSLWGFNSAAQAVRFTRRDVPGTSREAVGVHVGFKVIHML